MNGGNGLKKYSFEKLTLENVCLYTTLLKDYYNTYMNLKSCEVIFTKVTSEDYAKEDVYKTILKIKKLLDSTKDTNYLDIIFSDENHLNEFTIVKEYIDLITILRNLYIDAAHFLKPIKEVELAYEED